MNIEKMTELYASVFNIALGIEGASETERKAIVARREDILEKIKIIITDDYKRTGASKLTTRLLPVELASSEVERAITGGLS